jgi:hypothetical protein
MQTPTSPCANSLPVFPDKARLAQSIDITLAWQAVDKTTSDLGQDIEQLYSHLNHLEQENIQRSREILELKSSHSWKITGPIRLASKLGKTLLSRHPPH